MREMKKLGELGDIFIGLTYKPEDVVDEDGIIVLRSSNIQDGKLDFGDIVRVSCNVRDKLWVKENDILMCSRNGSAKLVGKTALISNLQEDMTFGAFMTIIRTPYNGYLQYFFKSPMFRRQLNSSATTTINQITRSMLDNIDVPILDNDTADNIKAILGKCEKIIQERKAEINALDELIKARFVELFGDPKLNEKGWNASVMSDYYEVKGGKRIPKGMGYAEGVTTHPYLRATDMKNETILDDYIHYIDEDVYEQIKRYTVKSGDIYLTNVGVNLGMAGVIPEKYDGANLTENAVKLVPKTEKVVDGLFLAHYINSPGIQDYINERKMSVGVPKLAIFRIETMPLLLPPMDIQAQFIEFYKQVDKSKVAVQKALDETQLLFDSLMQKYFG